MLGAFVACSIMAVLTAIEIHNKPLPLPIERTDLEQLQFEYQRQHTIIEHLQESLQRETTLLEEYRNELKKYK